MTRSQLSVEAYYCAAQTLRAKILYDFHELSDTPLINPSSAQDQTFSSASSSSASSVPPSASTPSSSALASQPTESTVINNAHLRFSLRDAILNHIMRFADGPAVVRSFLSLSFASLMVLMAREWRDSLPVITKTLGSQGRTAVMLLEILTDLPDEVENDRLRVDESIRKEAIA